MNGGFSSLRSEVAGAVKTVLVSAESLQLSLKPEFTQEEQALTQTSGKPKETHKSGYSSKSTHSWHTGNKK